MINLNLLVVSIIIASLAIPFYFNSVKPNPFFGFRIPITLKNNQAWYLVNRFFAKLIIYLCVVGAALSLFSYKINAVIDNLDFYIFACGLVFATLVTYSWANSPKRHFSSNTHEDTHN